MEQAKDNAPEGAQRNQGDGHQEPERTFTQAEVDEIVKDRLSRERKKTAKLFDEGYLSEELKEREAAVLKKELTYEAKDKLKESGIPEGVAELLRYEDREIFEESLEKAIKVFQPIRKQAVEEALKGSTPRGGNVDVSKDSSVRKAFGLE